MNKLTEFLKGFKRKVSQYGSKKIIEKAVIIAIVGVICLIAGSVIFEDSFKQNENTPAAGTTGENKSDTSSGLAAAEAGMQTKGEGKSEMEEKLRDILAQIKGAGKVDVMITFVSGKESIPATDVNSSDSSTQEKDKEGGSRDIKENSRENSIVYEESQGVKRPFVVKEILPEVKGVVIVADGGGDPEVKSNLTKAAQALLEVAAHRIQVFQRSNK
ncbi:hypothetical protein CLHUN_25900 [Ruminiclostridium hungatei]|uniref:Stage III sporulation protein AG n=1 Tax=Ruminiclostridium hungatei TaxID=48256 RepID=A0A1V4SI56_RUMHU|nr:stage III sporulation protein AG [Ruminiclostridium hungatei]OPX43443.1 hypothetical protein CLHUN_25900 [Ruminiclostridium hungatei]